MEWRNTCWSTRSTLSLVAVTVLCWSPSIAQGGDGYIGIYADSAGTQPCASVPPMTGTALYVIARLKGTTANGITSAEFRVEVDSPAGWWLMYSAPSFVSTSLGSIFDLDPQDPDDGSGINMAFSSCQQPVNGQVALGTISVFNMSGSPTGLHVKRHSSPTNAGYPCPLFTVCDAPAFSKSCMTPSTAPPCSLTTTSKVLTSAPDPAVFSAALNAETGGGGVEEPDPAREVVVRFKSGVIQFPGNVTAMTLQATPVNSSDVLTVLESHSVLSVRKAFPYFDVSETTGTNGAGYSVQLGDYSEFYVLQLPEGGDQTTLAADLSGLADVVNVSPNGTAVPGAQCTYGGLCPETVDCPDDPEFTNQWNMKNVGQGPSGGECGRDIRILEAWETTTGNPTMALGIIDFSIDADHFDLDGKITGDQTLGVFDHGTSVSGVVAAITNNGQGVAGVNQNAIIAFRDIENDDHPAIAEDVRAMPTLMARAVNCSFGLGSQGGIENQIFSPVVRLAFRDLYMQDIAAVAITHNHSMGLTVYPGGYGQGMITVGNSDGFDRRWSTSNWTPHIDVTAPVGAGIPVLLPERSSSPTGLGTNTGSSFAAPQVTGLIGLLLSVRNDLSVDDLEQIVRISADHPDGEGIWDEEVGRGRIDAAEALSLLEAPHMLLHREVTWYEGGDTPIFVSQGWMDWQIKPAPELDVGLYWTEKYEVQIIADFGMSFDPLPRVWGRGSQGPPTMGYNEEQDAGEPSPHQYGMAWCEPVEGQTRPNDTLLRTYIYTVYNADFTNNWWAPAEAQDLVLAYTVFGRTDGATDVGEADASTANQLRPSFRLRSPVGPTGSQMFLDLPRPQVASIAVYDVAGRLVRRIDGGSLGRGTHTLPFSAVDGRGTTLTSGIYLARVDLNGQRFTQKFTVVK